LSVHANDFGRFFSSLRSVPMEMERVPTDMESFSKESANGYEEINKRSGKSANGYGKLF